MAEFRRGSPHFLWHPLPAPDHPVSGGTDRLPLLVEEDEVQGGSFPLSAGSPPLPAVKPAHSLLVSQLFAIYAGCIALMAGISSLSYKTVQFMTDLGGEWGLRRGGASLGPGRQSRLRYQAYSMGGEQQAWNHQAWLIHPTSD